MKPLLSPKQPARLPAAEQMGVSLELLEATLPTWGGGSGERAGLRGGEKENPDDVTGETRSDLKLNIHLDLGL